MDESNTFLSPQGFPPNTVYGWFREIFFFYLANVCCVHSLESPRWGNSNEYTQHTFIIPKRYPTIISIMPPGMELIVTLRCSNYRCLEQIIMVPKGFEPSKFDCTCILGWMVTLKSFRRHLSKGDSFSLEIDIRYLKLSKLGVTLKEKN